MFKTMTKKEKICVLSFVLGVILWLSILTGVTIRDRMTPSAGAVAVSTPDEATPDEAIPETGDIEPIDITECTSAPATTVEPSVPIVEETKPVEEEVTEPVTTKPAKPAETKKPASSSSTNKTTSASKNNKPTATATSDTPSKGGMSETEMLACVIYQEVGGSKHCDECRRRVADVVLNRVADSRFPNTIEKVLTAKNQYGRFYWTGIKWADRHTWPGEKKAVEKAWKIAREVMAGNHSDLYGKGYVYQAGFKQGKSGFWCCGHYFAK